MTHCRSIANPSLLSYCEFLLQKNGLENVTEKPIPQTFYPLNSNPYHIYNSGFFADKLRVDLALTVQIDQITRGADYLRELSQKPKQATLAESPFSFLRPISSESPPWEVFPGIFDQPLLEKEVKFISLISQALKRKYSSEKSEEYQKAMISALMKHFRAPKSEGGWGLIYKRDEILPKSPRKIFDSQKTSCHPFVYLFLTHSRIAGLDSFPVEIFRNNKGEWIGSHVEVAVRLHQTNGKEKILFLNLENQQPIERKPEDWVETTPAELVATAYSNWAVAPALPYSKKDLNGDYRRVPREILNNQIPLFEEGLRYSRHYFVLANYAACLFNLGGEQNLHKAIQLFEEAENLNPHFFRESPIGQAIKNIYLSIKQHAKSSDSISMRVP